MKTFGEYLKELRISKGFSLREFCRKAEIDPTLLSRIERNILPPPHKIAMLEKLRLTLNLAEDSNEFRTLKELAIMARLPQELLSPRIMAKLPVFFKITNTAKANSTELNKLIEIMLQ